MMNLIRKLFGFSRAGDNTGKKQNVSIEIDSQLELIGTGGEKKTAALKALGNIASDFDNRLEILNRMIVHPDGNVRAAVPEFLRSIDPDPIEPLLEVYYSGDLDLTSRTLELFRLLSGFTSPFLFDRVRGEDEEEQRQALHVLSAMGSDAVSHFLVALSDQSIALRRGAALCLARMGDEARMAVTALVEALGDEDDDVRFRAAFALKQMGGVEYREEADAVIKELAEPLGALDTMEIYHAESSLERARIVSEHPVTGEILEDGRGGRFLTPEEDDRGGGMGAVKILGHSMVVYPGLGKVVEVSGVYDREIGLLAEEVKPVERP